MSFYVKRTRLSDDKVGWTGPIMSAVQAQREAAVWCASTEFDVAAWKEVPTFTAVVVESTPEVRAEVRAWDKAKATR